MVGLVNSTIWLGGGACCCWSVVDGADTCVSNEIKDVISRDRGGHRQYLCR